MRSSVLKLVVLCSYLGLGAATASAAPSVTILPVRILDGTPRAITIEVQFPEGISSITGLAATYGGLDVLELLVPFITEVTATSGRIAIPPLVFPGGTETVFEFRIDSTAGSASDRLRIAVPPAGVVYGYAVRGDIDDKLYRINLLTGAATSIGPTGYEDIEGSSFDRNGVLYAVDDASDLLLTISLESGAATPVGPLGIDVGDEGLAFDSSGTLWMTTDEPSHQLYSVNIHTGRATLRAALVEEVKGLAALGSLLYGADFENDPALITIDPATNQVHSVGPFVTIDSGDAGLDFDAGGALVGVEDEGGKIFVINLNTGRATQIATTLIGFENLAIHPPE